MASDLASDGLHGRRLGATLSSELVVGVLTSAGAVALVTAVIAVTA